MIRLPMEGTRRSILEVLQKDGGRSVEELATAVGLASATIRRHLDILQRDGLVAFGVVRRKTGRPQYVFSLTEAGHAALPKEYEWLLRKLTAELVKLTPEDTATLNGRDVLVLAYRRTSERVLLAHGAEFEGQDSELRVATLVRVLEGLNFRPVRESTGQAILIRLLNCPFRSVALEDRAVCAFDASLISTALGADTDRRECIQDGDVACTYAVAKVGAR